MATAEPRRSLEGKRIRLFITADRSTAIAGEVISDWDNGVLMVGRMGGEDHIIESRWFIRKPFEYEEI